MKQGILLVIGILALLSCGKDNFETNPKLTLNSVSSEFIPRNFDLRIRMRVTDQEGDIGDTIWIQKISSNCVFSNYEDSSLLRFPGDVPRVKNLDAEITVDLDYARFLSPQCIGRNDSAVFRFWLKDRDGNSSDTVTTPTIVIER